MKAPDLQANDGQAYGWFCPHCPFKSKERDEVVSHSAHVGHGEAIRRLWVPTIRGRADAS
jgi:hypothetical protein